MSPVAWLLAKLALVALPLVVLGWAWGIFPARRLVALALLPMLVSLALVFTETARGPLLAFDTLLVTLAVADLFSLPRRRHFIVQRSHGRSASLERSQPVTLSLRYTGTRALAARLRDGVPAGLQAEPDHFPLQLVPHSRQSFDYRIRAKRRGAFALEATFLEVTSSLALWRRYQQLPAASTLHVYPDMKQLDRYSVLARTNRLNLVGVRRIRRVGRDNEFERLRDYTPDDNYKHIDWRSTARRRKLTVKDFQQNQSQRLLFLVDCGRMMTNEATGLTLLDHALNSMLMLSYVALTKGDAVGLLSFGERIHSFVPVRGGMQQMNRLLHASFDRFPQLVESRYESAFLHTAAHCRKRTLVILITNLIDEVNAHQVTQHLRVLVGRHLPLLVLLRDRRIFAPLEVPHDSGPELYRAAAAADLLAWRHEVLTGLTNRGVLSLDLFPEDLTAPLVNRYLDIKARHLL